MAELLFRENIDEARERLTAWWNADKIGRSPMLLRRQSVLAAAVATVIGVGLTICAGCGNGHVEVSAPAAVTWLDLSRPDIPRLETVETGYVSFDCEDSHGLLGDGWRDEEQDKRLIIHEGKVLWAASIQADLRLTVLQPRALTLMLECSRTPCAPRRPQKFPPVRHGRVEPYHLGCLPVCQRGRLVV